LNKLKILLLFLLSGIYLFSETNTIKKIEVKGLKTVSKAEVLDAIKTKKGDVLSLEKVNSDIEEIYNLGYFKDVVVDWDEKNKVLNFIVKEKPKVKKIEFKGNKIFSDRKLKGKIELKKRDFFDEKKLKESVSKLLNFYKDRGYVSCKVEGYHTEEDDGIRLSFFIEEGKKVLLSKINIIGVMSFPKKKIKKLLKTKINKVFKSEVFEEDIKNIENFYKDRGYFDVDISKPVILYSKDKTKIFVTVNIFEGKKYKITDYSFEGNVEFSSEQLKKLVSFKIGDIYIKSKVDQTISNIINKYMDSGYLRANIDTEYEKDEEKGELKIKFNINEGGIIYVNKIYLEGNYITKDYVIKREFQIKEGEPLKAEKVRATQRNLYNLGFFQDVNVEPVPVKGKPNLVDLVITVEEQKTGIASLGAGYSSDSGMLMNFQVSQKNLFGRGQSLSFLWEIGERAKNYQISFYEPWLFNNPYPFGFSLYNMLRKKEYTYEENDTKITDLYDETRKGGDIKIGRYFAKIYSVHLEYSYEKVSLDNVDSDYMIEQQQRSQEKGRTSAVTIRLKRDSRDNIFDASRGSLYMISWKIAGKILGGDNHFHKEIFEISYFFPLIWKFVLGFHTEGGKVSPFKGEDIPIYEKFYIGGAETVRGYEYRGEIGPAEGGSLYSVSNIEIKFPLVSEKGHTVLQGAFFFDVGGLWNNRKEIEFAFGEGENNFKRGYGFGIRFKTPVFPIRLDWGKGLDHRRDEATTQWYFTIGQLF